MAFAASALLVAALWLGFSHRQHAPVLPWGTTQQVADEQMMEDLPVLEDHDVISNFEPLKELPAPVQAEPGFRHAAADVRVGTRRSTGRKETRESDGDAHEIQIRDGRSGCGRFAAVAGNVSAQKAHPDRPPQSHPAPAPAPAHPQNQNHNADRPPANPNHPAGKPE